jgi:hypothetical protein
MRGSRIAGGRTGRRSLSVVAFIETFDRSHRAPETAADLERRLDDGVARQARRNRFEIRHFPGWAAADHSVILLVGSGRVI